MAKKKIFRAKYLTSRVLLLTFLEQQYTHTEHNTTHILPTFYLLNVPNIDK